MLRRSYLGANGRGAEDCFGLVESQEKSLVTEHRVRTRRRNWSVSGGLGSAAGNRLVQRCFG